jgi:hypothetical protein
MIGQLLDPEIREKRSAASREIIAPFRIEYTVTTLDDAVRFCSVFVCSCLCSKPGAALRVQPTGLIGLVSSSLQNDNTSHVLRGEYRERRCVPVTIILRLLPQTGRFSTFFVPPAQSRTSTDNPVNFGTDSREIVPGEQANVGFDSTSTLCLTYPRSKWLVYAKFENDCWLIARLR